MDYALFLFNTAKFYLGSILYIIDEADFLRRIHEFYDDPVGKAVSSRSWYAQFLLILAFGKASISNESSRDGPPGYQYAAQAMSLMPDLAGLAPDPIQAVQALALGAVYLQSVDMRVGACHHILHQIGHALRTCIVEGWHRHMPEEVVGIEHSRRCNIIFWVVYRLDREFGPLMGCPCSICDGDITAKLPSEMDESLSALNMSLHVRLSRLMARILTAIYGVGEQFDGSLVPNTQKVLRELAQLSKDINELLNTHFQGSISKASRMALRLILSYHHSCVDSAMIILRTLRGMGDEDLLEAFLPFQLEDASSSAFILYLIRTINPSLLTDERWSEDVKHVLDKMIAKGSVAAPLRKRELGQLEDALVAVSPVCDEPTTPSVGHPEHQAAIASTVRPADSGWDLFLENGIVGISPTEMLDLAAQLEVDNDFGPQVMDW
ncbi:hypothetical protein SLS58_006457 [Diplodia intermedia]|uniref:Xylanolytic transcriptional activator regulatory domain-containing protein n=1 Tax=Diplodia intermedia TaxID=856260 RepID=A0ABR3TN81_9PEZI